MKIFKHNIFKSISTGYILFFVNNIVALFLTPFILKYISKEEFGLYVLCVELFTWLGFLQFGTAKVLGPLVSTEIVKDNKERIITLFNSSFLFQLGMSILVVPIFYFVVKLGQKGEQQIIENAGMLVLLFAIASGMGVLTQQLSEMLIAAKRMHVDNILNIIFTALRVALILALIPFFKIQALFAVYLAISVLQFLRSYFRVKKLYPYLNIKFSLFSINEFKGMLSNGIYFTIGSVATILILKFDSFYIGNQIGLEFISKLYISTKLVILGQKVIELLFNNFRPYISSFYGKKDYHSIQQFFRFSSVINFAMSSLILSCILIVNKTFVKFWVGEEFYLGDKLVFYYSMFYFIYVLSQPARIVLVSTLRNIKETAISRIIEGLLRVSILILFFKNFGVELLPLSSFAFSLIFSYFFTFYLLTKIMYWKANESLVMQGIAMGLLPVFLILLSYLVKLEHVFYTFLYLSIILIFVISYKHKTRISKLITLNKLSQ